MTRLRRSTASLPAIFRSLGPAPSVAELAGASEAVKGNAEALELPSQAAADWGELWDRVVEIAEQNGASGFCALDLLVTVLSGPEALRRKAPLQP